MSRIGKLNIPIPNDVDINYENFQITIKGKFGILQTHIPKALEVIEKDKILTIEVKENIKNVKAIHGLYRTLINNMVIGVSKQFEIILTLNGVGYRASVTGNELILNLGYSHPVQISIPESITVEVIKNTTISLKSCDKELLGLFAANIRSWRRPEPYKGKGILYKNEQILRKAGKSGK
uniref:ribosomal protein L6 n=1 Tax=Thalassionema nitzschioides TaxID=33649 RepID=UPI001EDEB206|nr:ribosomal protein L6 [Thalassionema nitzschioides]UHY40687.1 ribosomal protein L6 [Thalassionema nitzschioides]